MKNASILKALETQRNILFNTLNNTSISALYQEQYDEIKDGRIFFLGGGDKEELRALKPLCKDKSLDLPFKNKVNAYTSFDNDVLIAHFKKELIEVFEKIIASGQLAEIQAVFIEYDNYDDTMSCVECYGKQPYPIVEVPRYLGNEIDYNKRILLIAEGINFAPTWTRCDEFEPTEEYLTVRYDLELLFKLNSHVLIHHALEQLFCENKLDFIFNKPFIFYINEHDCDVMTLYRVD